MSRTSYVFHNPHAVKTAKVFLYVGYVYLNRQSPRPIQSIASVYYTDGQTSHLELVKFSKKCDVLDAMRVNGFLPDSSEFRQGREIGKVLTSLHKFADNRTIVVYNQPEAVELIISIVAERSLDIDFEFIDFSHTLKHVIPSLPLESFMSSALEGKGKGNGIDYVETLKFIFEFNRVNHIEFMKSVHTLYVERELAYLKGLIGQSAERINAVRNNLWLSDVDSESVDSLLLSLIRS